MDTALDQLQRESINYPSGKQRGIEIVLLGSKHGRDTRERHHGGRQNHPLNKQKKRMESQPSDQEARRQRKSNRAPRAQV